MSERTLTAGFVIGIVIAALLAPAAMGAAMDGGNAAVEHPAAVSPASFAQDNATNNTTTAANATTATTGNESANLTPGIQNISVRKLNVDRLTLRNVVVRSGTAQQVLVKYAAQQANASNASNASAASDLGISNASVDGVTAVNVTMTDVTLRNVSVYNDSLARTIFAKVVTGNKTGNRSDVPQNVSLESYTTGSLTIKDRSIDGLFVGSAVIQNATLKNRTSVSSVLGGSYENVTTNVSEANWTSRNGLGLYSPTEHQREVSVAVGEAIIGNVVKARLSSPAPSPAANETTMMNETTAANQTTQAAGTTMATATTQAAETTAANQMTTTQAAETTAANQMTTTQASAMNETTAMSETTTQ